MRVLMAILWGSIVLAIFVKAAPMPTKLIEIEWESRELGYGTNDWGDRCRFWYWGRCDPNVW